MHAATMDSRTHALPLASICAAPRRRGLGRDETWRPRDSSFVSLRFCFLATAACAAIAIAIAPAASRKAPALLRPVRPALLALSESSSKATARFWLDSQPTAAAGGLIPVLR